MSHGPKTRPILVLFAALLFIPIGILQLRIDPWRKQYEPVQTHDNVIVSKLPIGFALGALTGFREAVAGLLWVRADEFFHTGDYEAIKPLIRIITWLDPHWVDPYETGAWHMDYNFTDTDQRSDRRYIPLSVALMKEGIANNPDVPELYGDLALTHYFRKIGDFKMAAKCFLEGQQVVEKLRKQAGGSLNNIMLSDGENLASSSVLTTTHGLAHAYEALGEIPQALKQWQYCVNEHKYDIKHNIGNKFSSIESLDVARRELQEMTVRAKFRPIEVKNPINVHFSATIERTASKQLLIQGTFDAIGATGPFNFNTGKTTWGPVNGCRIGIRLQDSTYKVPVFSSLTLSNMDINSSTTIMQDSVSVQKGKFFKRIDMSQDPEMYSFTAPKYTLTLWFNPSNPNDCPINVQDRIGWLGEGMTDGKHLDLNGVIPGEVSSPVPGLHMIKETWVLTKEDLTGLGVKILK